MLRERGKIVHGEFKVKRTDPYQIFPSLVNWSLFSSLIIIIDEVVKKMWNFYWKNLRSGDEKNSWILRISLAKIDKFIDQKSKTIHWVWLEAINEDLIVSSAEIIQSGTSSTSKCYTCGYTKRSYLSCGTLSNFLRVLLLNWSFCLAPSPAPYSPLALPNNSYLNTLTCVRA